MKRIWIKSRNFFYVIYYLVFYDTLLCEIYPTFSHYKKLNLAFKDKEHFHVVKLLLLLLLFIYLVKQVSIYNGSEIYTDVDLRVKIIIKIIK